jgi:hypothetical protein
MVRRITFLDLPSNLTGSMRPPESNPAAQIPEPRLSVFLCE